MNTAAAEKPAQHPAAERQGLIQWAGQKFGVDAGKVFPILKATCFKADKDGREATDAEVAALMIVAREHGLNPFLKEIYAFPDKRGGIVPVVGVDGWISIINDHPKFNGVDFKYEKEDANPAWIECHIYRSDREHPIKVREFMGECRRETGPWKSHPSRMLRHKALIQCARVAFGFAGIYDEDEAERIIEAQGQVVSTVPAGGARGAAGLKAALNGDGIDLTQQPAPAGNQTTSANESTQAAEPKAKQPGTPAERDLVVKRMKEAKSLDALNAQSAYAQDFEWTKPDRAVIDEAYKARKEELEL